jgi:pimeloyl-ACP methyl ester carboxylesterase
LKLIALGSGGAITDFIFVHGGLHDGWCWHLVREELERRGHRTWAPDLPVDDPGAGASQYADVVCEAGEESGRDVIVVGHSLGGLTIPVVAQRRPVGRLVFLAASVPDPGRSYADVVASGPTRPGPSRTFDDKGYLSFPPSVAASIFYHDCPPDVVVEALEHLRPQASRPIVETTPLEAWPDVPANYIACREDRLMSRAYAMAVVRDRLGTEIVEMDGGHSPFLARPGDLVRLLLELRRNDREVV